MIIQGHPMSVSGSFIRTARLQDEYYDCAEEPLSFVQAVKQSDLSADLLTITPGLASEYPALPFHKEADLAAVLDLTTYEHWWKKQVNDKTRNMVRKAGKAGVEIRSVDFNDDLVRGIHTIYNECPFRQGRKFRHFGKNFETVRREHESFLDRSEFVGAFFNEELIGFIKLVHGNGVSNLMNIISLVSHRDKAPTNALLARAVEICTARGIPRLHYGTWSRRTMGDFKKHHAFKPVEVPRYFIPLSLKGSIALRLKAHKKLEELLPESWVDYLADLRLKWNTSRLRRSTPPPPRAVQQPAQT